MSQRTGDPHSDWDVASRRSQKWEKEGGFPRKQGNGAQLLNMLGELKVNNLEKSVETRSEVLARGRFLKHKDSRFRDFDSQITTLGSPTKLEQRQLQENIKFRPKTVVAKKSLESYYFIPERDSQRVNRIPETYVSMKKTTKTFGEGSKKIISSQRERMYDTSSDFLCL
eukprot:TRINITY_DN880_c0_g1_i1.p1 TRINITY_DN880_c0_g1~~TRINITY_DN880_c0_g1_i1.p1  ORF type:complete len:169 (-),score=55.02 TRINITY_DN880_c0_g1_i1:149-655(-)